MPSIDHWIKGWVQEKAIFEMHSRLVASSIYNQYGYARNHPGTLYFIYSGYYFHYNVL